MHFKTGRLIPAFLLLAAACSAGSTAKSGDDFKRGRAMYVHKICATCHHEDGTGNNPVGKALKVPDLTTATFKQGESIEAIVTTIREGVPESAMVPFRNIIDEDEARLIAIYIQGIRKKRSSR